MKPYIFVNLACIDVESLEILDYCSSSAKEFPVLMSLVVSGRKFTCPIPKEALEAWVKDYGIQSIKQEIQQMADGVGMEIEPPARRRVKSD